MALRLAAGESIIHIAADPTMPAAVTIHRWLNQPAFADEVKRLAVEAADRTSDKLDTYRHRVIDFLLADIDSDDPYKPGIYRIGEWFIKQAAALPADTDGDDERKLQGWYQHAFEQAAANGQWSAVARLLKDWADRYGVGSLALTPDILYSVYPKKKPDEENTDA